MTYNRLSNTNEVQAEKRIVAPYFALVNLQTQRWTTELMNPLVIHASMQALTHQLSQFYEDEMGSCLVALGMRV